MPIKAILFDHDGTLVDSEVIHYQLWADVLKPYGVNLSAQAYQQYYAGIPGEENARDMVERFALTVDPALIKQSKDQVTSAFLAQQAFPLMPQAQETVRYFSARGLRLAVVTGANRQGIEATMKAHGLHDQFATVVSGDDVAHSKPAPEAYLLALERLNLAAHECIAIEDTQAGASAAISAGIACVAVPTPMSVQHDFSGALATFDSLALARHWIAGQL